MNNTEILELADQYGVNEHTGSILEAIGHWPDDSRRVLRSNAFLSAQILSLGVHPAVTPQTFDAVVEDAGGMGSSEADADAVDANAEDVESVASKDRGGKRSKLRE